MKPRKVAFFVDAVLSDRRPAALKADPIDADVLRMAIAIRSARAGKAAPGEQFVANLRQELVIKVREATLPPARPFVTRRARLLLAAAAVTTMGGTVAATTSLEHVLAAANVTQVSKSNLVRVGNFEAKGGQAVGQIVAYSGDPSWVLMSIRDPAMNATVVCRIEMSKGSTAATATFVVHNGVGEYARPVSVDIGQFRKAALVAPDGSVLATASFPAR